MGAAQLDLFAWVRPEPKVEAPPMPKRANLGNKGGGHGAEFIGRVFGKLTVVAPAPKPRDVKATGKWWLCRCECGGEIVNNGGAMVTRAKAGHVLGCKACHGKTIGERTSEDIAGQRFGSLVAIKPVPLPPGRRRGVKWWLFKCDCGADVERSCKVAKYAAQRGLGAACHRCLGIKRRTPRPKIVIKSDEPIYGEYTIYCHTHVASQRRYVGFSKNGLHVRWRQHVSSARKPNTSFSAAIHEFGEEAFFGEVLEVVDTFGAAQEAEQWWIQHFGSIDPALGYNRTAGGESPYAVSEETKQLHRVASKRAYDRMTPEKRSALREALLAGGAAWRARATPEEKAAIGAKISASTKKRFATMTDEQRVEYGKRLSVAVSAGMRRANNGR